MGSGFEAKCKCGFNQKNISFGCGMAMDYLEVAGPCKICKKITAVSIKMPIEDKDIPSKCICPKCKNPFQPYQDFEDCGHNFSSEKGGSVCPKCGKKTLKFRFTFLWD